MARKSRWQQFADSFNSTYETFTNAAKNIETAKVNKQEFKDAEGGLLEGTALDRARTKALADIYTKYGDAEGGLALRSSAEGLGAMTRENDIGEATKQDQIYQQGLGGTRQLDANIANTGANTANTYSTMNRRDTLLPGEVVQQDLTAQSTAAGTLGQRLTNQYAERTMDSRVDNQFSSARLNNANATVAEETVGSRVRSSEAEAAASEADAEVSTATVDNRITQSDNDTSMSNAELQEVEATAQARIDAAMSDYQASIEENKTREMTASDINTVRFIASEVLSEAMNKGFETEAETEAFFVEEVAKATRGIPAAAAYLKSMNEMGIARLTADAMNITKRMETARRENGLDGMADAYEGVLDNVDAYVDRSTPGVVRVMGRREDGEAYEIMSARGEDAEAQMEAKIAARVKDPMAMLEVAATVADLEQKRANVAETGANTDRIETATEGQRLTNRGLAAEMGPDAIRRRIAVERIEQFSNPDFQELLYSDPTAAMAMMAEYDRANNTEFAPPANVPVEDLERWYVLTPEAMKLFREAEENK